MTMSACRVSALPASGGFTSVRMRRPVSGISSTGLAMITSESPCLVLPSQAVAHQDGGEVEQQDDAEQQDRGGVHHGLGRLDVGALEADVVDVESEVHELAV